MATFREKAAHSVNRMFFLYFVLLLFYVFPPTGFEDVTLVLIASVPGRCLSFTFCCHKYKTIF